jgi:hypothetical protein
VTEVSQEAELRYVRNRTAILGGHVKKHIGLGASALAITAAVGSLALISPSVADAAPGGGPSAVNVVGEPYAKAVQILKSQGVSQRFNGSFAGQIPQSFCIVDQQKATKEGVMLLHLDCTQKAADNATDDTPATGGTAAAPGAPGAPGAAPGAPAPGAGQGTYGGPIGVPVPVG